MRFIIIRGGSPSERREWIEENTGYNQVAYSYDTFLLMVENIRKRATMDRDYVINIDSHEAWKVSPYLYHLHFHGYQPIVITIVSEKGAATALPRELLLVTGAEERIVYKPRTPRPIVRVKRHEADISNESDQDSQSGQD